MRGSVTNSVGVKVHLGTLDHGCDEDGERRDGKKLHYKRMSNRDNDRSAEGDLTVVASVGIY